SSVHLPIKVIGLPDAAQYRDGSMTLRLLCAYTTAADVACSGYSIYGLKNRLSGSDHGCR
ncbi:MAG TPA: hypothetical protein VII18_04845, partial [Mycobacterium sp.]